MLILCAYEINPAGLIPRSWGSHKTGIPVQLSLVGFMRSVYTTVSNDKLSIDTEALLT